jgi:hypothetical protein
MLYTDYQTTFTTAFVEFRETLTESRMAFIDFEILRQEEYFQDFVLQTIKLRRIYEKVFESDMHTDFLQPKVEIIYNLIQDKIEALRNFEPKVTNEVSRLQEQMNYYMNQFEALIQK